MRPQFGSARLHLEAGFLVVSWRKCDILNAARTHLLSHLHESAKSESIAVQICLIGIMKWCHIRCCIPQQPDFVEGIDRISGSKRLTHFFVQLDLLLLRPRISDEERQEAIQHLDTVLTYIHDGKATFEEAAAYFSMDKKTRNNGGLIFNEEDADSKLPRETIEGEMARQVNKLKVGEISSPFLDQTRTGEEYKVIKIKAYYPSHTANLDDDWISFENGLKSKKQQEVLDKWIKEKQANTYIHIDEDYKNSKFHYDGWFK